MALPEFRRALTQALVQPDEIGDPPTDLNNTEAVQRYLGVRYLLLAPVFGITAHELRVGGDKEPSIVIGLGSLADEVSVEEFREVIREAVRREEQASRPQRPFAIDLGKIPEAEAALKRGDHERTIELLDPWAGPLSMLLRTPQGQSLGAEAKAALARALGLLGAAYTKREEYPSAEEVLRPACCGCRTARWRVSCSRSWARSPCARINTVRPSVCYAAPSHSAAHAGTCCRRSPSAFCTAVASSPRSPASTKRGSSA
jgi:hypothetical protein